MSIVIEKGKQKNKIPAEVVAQYVAWSKGKDRPRPADFLAELAGKNRSDRLLSNGCRAQLLEKSHADLVALASKK